MSRKKAKKKETKFTSDQVKAMLEEKIFFDGRTLIAFEVANGTGSHAGRYADAVSMEMWPSRGFEITGYEIKVSRSDWLNELKQPEKSQPISQFCDYWYLVAPTGILGIDELPSTWGYMQVNQGGITKKIKAPKRESIDANRSFFSSFVRKAIKKYSNENLIHEIKRQAQEDAEKYQERHFKSKIERLEEEIKSYKEKEIEFEKTTGVPFNRWRYQRTKEALDAVRLKDDRLDLMNTLKVQAEEYERTAKAIKGSIEALKDYPSS